MGTNLGHRFLDWLSWSYGCRLSLTSLMVSTCLWPLPLLFTAPLASTHWALTSHTFLGESLPPLAISGYHSPTASEPLNANEPSTQVAAPKPMFIATAFHNDTEENWAPDST